MKESDTTQFTEVIRERLNIPTTEKARRITGRILFVLRDQLDHDDAISFIHKLSPDLIMIALSGWPLQTEVSGINHLDEFVHLVIEQDRQQKQQVFATEIEALRASLFILGRLDQAFDIQKFLPGNLHTEMLDAQRSDAA